MRDKYNISELESKKSLYFSEALFEKLKFHGKLSWARKKLFL